MDIEKPSKIDESKIVAIVVPIHKGELTEDEKISLKHLTRYLGRYDKYLVLPDSIDFYLKGFKSVKLPKEMYGKYKMYNQRLLTKNFYQAFNAYQYILIYHLDSLVFSDQLLDWCQKGYDYVGAPWPANWCHVRDPLGRDMLVAEEAVGNGGFSLRNVKAALKVLNIYYSPLNRFKINFMRAIRLILKLFKALRRAAAYLFSRKTIEDKAKKGVSFAKNISSAENYEFSRNEDVFWSFLAKKYYPEFKLPSPEVALSFAFEAKPREYFKRNNNSLPFGCHAWPKFDRDFWQTYLLK